MKTKLTEPREISFRVWNEKENKFLSKNIKISDNFSKQQVITNVFGRAAMGYKYVFQQFTGLLDKTGRKIFEGDILNSLGKNFKILFRGSSFYIENIEDDEEWYHLDSCILDRYKIIGNILENPNLLKL